MTPNTPTPPTVTPPVPTSTDGRHSPFELLLGEIDGVIAEWRALMAPQPWALLPPSRLIDAMPEILPRLIRLANVGATFVDEELRLRIADDHGAARRTDEMPIAAVAEEWSFLKRACWTVLRRNGVVQAEAENAMRRLDLLIDDAVGYTLRGYYRTELDSLRGQGLERRDGAGNRRANDGDRRERSGA
ncbi:MAG: hypothetical protein M3081_21005 [Gemmatimonadota bacterium]|nr:hypothetical protein [Gemmatimonadota bacterium]